MIEGLLSGQLGNSKNTSYLPYFYYQMKLISVAWRFISFDNPFFLLPFTTRISVGLFFSHSFFLKLSR